MDKYFLIIKPLTVHTEDGVISIDQHVEVSSPEEAKKCYPEFIDSLVECSVSKGSCIPYVFDDKVE